ncbi:MAG: DUF5658 family protein [Phycisphaerales bacterium]
MLAALQSAGATPPRGWAFAPLSHALTPQARCTRILLLVFATLVMCVGDLYMTLTFALSVGMIEANPIARELLQEHPVAVLVIWKLATLAFFGSVLYFARKTRVGEIAAWACFFIMGGLTVHWLSYTTRVSGFTAEFAALAMSDDPRWIALDQTHTPQLRRLSQWASANRADPD